MAVRLSPIGPSDIPAVAQFLHAELNSRLSPQAWAEAMETPWKVDAPNHGFALYDADQVVGAYLAFYSERDIRGQLERFCNLAAWCVRPEQRFGAPRLLRALLSQPGYHFTDLSPSGNVVAVNTRLKFEFLDTTTALVPNLPWPGRLGGAAVSADPAVIERTLVGRDLEIYRDHAAAAAARHVVLRRGNESCYVVFRKDRRKNLPLFASILYVSNPDLLRRMWRPLGAHLLLRHGAIATLAERRIVGEPPRGSRNLGVSRRKMFKSSTLGPADIDYLYSELVSVAW